MNEVLEKLYQNTIRPSNKEMSHDRTYLCERNRANQLYEVLREKLSEEDVKILDKMAFSSHKQRERENMRFFVNGFKMGMGFAIENMQ